MRATQHRIILAIIDIGVINISLYLSFALRFDNKIPQEYYTLFKETHVIVTVIALCSFIFQPV